MPAFLAPAAAARASVVVPMGPCRRVDDMETGHLVDRAAARRIISRGAGGVVTRLRSASARPCRCRPARVSNIIQTRLRDRLMLANTERFPVISPPTQRERPRTLADCDFGWSPDRPAEGTEPRGRVNSLSVGVCV